jgi:hypothetical protein
VADALERALTALGGDATVVGRHGTAIARFAGVEPTDLVTAFREAL